MFEWVGRRGGNGCLSGWGEGGGNGCLSGWGEGGGNGNRCLSGWVGRGRWK